MKAPNAQEQRAEASYIPVRGRKERKAIPLQTISGILNESPSHRRQVKGKKFRESTTNVNFDSSMKVVHTLNTPDVRHEITLLRGCLGTPGSGQRRNQPQGTPKGGVCQKGLGVFCTRGKRGNSSMEPPAGTLHLRILNRLGCLTRGSQQVSGGGCRRT